tara:strand:- start:19279 stop:19980 length:702 start_codon:yes stop_codon:yes gene_type:complete
MQFQEPNEVKNIFNSVSCQYDLLNDLLSFGVHKLWKKKLVTILNPLNGEDWADLCCGTGDMAILISKNINPNGSIVGVDNAINTLNIARKKSKYISEKVLSWREEDIFDLDEQIKRFDGIVMSYGLRNLSNVEDGIKKVFLLLKDKGRAGFLDFNHSKKGSPSYIFQKIYLRFIVVPISKFFNLKEEYQYIEESIKNFPEGKKLISLAKKVGFKQVSYKKLFFGQMGILVVKK